jgi:hypothetical protein
VGRPIGVFYGFFVAVDNHGISWRESHKKPNKMHFSCGSAPAKAIDKLSTMAGNPVCLPAETQIRGGFPAFPGRPFN